MTTPAASALQPGDPAASIVDQVVFSRSGRAIAFRRGDSLWIARRDSGAAWTILAGAAGLTSQAGFGTPFVAWAPDERRLLYRAGTQGAGRAGTPLIMDIETGRTLPLLPDSLLPQLLTTPNFLTAPPRWSPDGTRIAFIGRYLRPGSLPALFVVDVGSGAVGTPGCGQGSQYAAEWSPDGRWLACGTGELRGGQGSIVLLDAHALEAGAARIAVTDSARLFNRLVWSPDASRLLAQDRGGGHEVIAVDTNGRTTRLALTLPRVPYHGWTADGDGLIASHSVGMNAHVLLVSATTGFIRPLTAGDSLFRLRGVAHDASLGKSTVLAFTVESGVAPREIWTMSLADGEARPRTRVTNVSREFPRARLARSMVHRWTSVDGDTLEAQLFLPGDAASHGRRPLVVLPYGAYVNEFPNLDYFLSSGIFPLVERGHVVARPNTRGTSSDTRDRGQYGRLQLDDTERLIASLAREGLVNGDRVAVIGHSHGGAMAYYYLTHSRSFCAVVAVNGRADWYLQARHPYDGLLPGILGGTPEELPAVYADFSPSANARRAVAPLLAVAGGEDGQILPENARLMVDSMHAAGKAAELLHFDGDGHLLGPESARRFWARTYAFLEEHCGAR